MKNKSNMIIAIVSILVLLGAIWIGLGGGMSKTFGDDEIQMHFFYARTCPHCHAQMNIHAGLQERYPNLNIIKYETSLPSTQTKLQEFAQAYPDQLDLKKFGTPTTIIGDTVLIGFSPESTPASIISLIESQQKNIDASWDETTMTRTIDL